MLIFDATTKKGTTSPRCKPKEFIELDKDIELSKQYEHNEISKTDNAILISDEFLRAKHNRQVQHNTSTAHQQE